MGIVQRQGIKQSLVNYLGVALGAITTLFVVRLAMEENGLLRFLVSTAALSLSLVSFGSNTIIIKFFPEFADKKSDHHGFLGLMLLITGIGFLIFLVFILLFKNSIIGFYDQKPEVYLNYLPSVIFIVLFMSLGNIMKFYASNFQRTVVPYILSDFLIKVGNPVILLLYYYRLVSLDSFVLLIILMYFLIFALLTSYLYLLGELKLKFDFVFLTRERKKRLMIYGMYGLLGSLGAVISFQIDIFMIGNILTLYNVSLYTQGLFIASTVGIPTQALINIISPLVSSASAKNDLAKIEDLYKRSSINLLIVGSFIYLLICMNLDDFFLLIPGGNILLKCKYVIIFLGFAKIFDQLTSINGQIISYSKYFRFNFYIVMFLAILNIFLNLALIPRYHIDGAAFATMLSILIYNTIKFVYIYYKFKIHPLSYESIKLIFLVIFSYLLISYLPLDYHPVINIALRSILVLLIFSFSIYKFKLSKEIVTMITRATQKWF